MRALVNSIRLILTKKFFIIYITIFVLILCLLNLMNPVPILVRGLFSEIAGDTIDNLIVLVNSMFNKNTVLFYIFVCFAIALGLATVVSLFFSGPLFMLSKTVDDSDYKPKRLDYFKGFFNCFVKLALVLFILFYAILMLLYSFIIIIFPALLVGKIAGTGANGNGTYEFFLIVTLIIIYLLLLFLRVYLMYMIPASFKTVSFYKTSLKVAGSSFVTSVTTLIGLDLIYIGTLSYIGMLNSGAFKLILLLLANTLFWTIFIVWLFYKFNHTIIKKKIILE